MAIFAYYQALLRRKVRGAMFSLTGGIFLLIGVAFLTAALWILLVEWRSALFAATVIGLVFCAIGFIAMGIGAIVGRLRVRHVPPMHRAAAGAPLLQLLEGFLVGIDAGRRSRRPPRE
ncbi:phage holin family protein [Roseivivax sediminis]|uniref:Holin-X, holin superfamily III n=1 Tax=Roseivivax sediminis TaxID=936889 RepID=A0A1I2CBY5_9RHOB|nr:phage holin family protein [Roseivivax sediminis]SFE65313.1 Putative Holin-X, holin superfamily III [Roseivivax sediminis]